MAIVFVSALAAFVVAIVMVRFLRRRIIQDDSLPESLATEGTPYPYTAVIQQLKQQKFSLENERQIERRRAKMSEYISSAVLANLPCGILFLAPTGLVRQANAAARQMLGFASPLGMSVEDLFAGAQAITESATVSLAEVFRDALRGEAGGCDFEISYSTPAGQRRVLKLSIIPLRFANDEGLGVAALINDETQTAELRSLEILRTENAAELALDLRTSLGSIRGYVDQMCASDEHEPIQRLAKVICSETERLESVVGGFLIENGRRKAFAARG
ncbi:MAG: PAS domain-containing protein [Acidobacteria bacterium]|nr:PAS domain-containing protein [Acidobacteriota bacterium]